MNRFTQFALLFALLFALITLTACTATRYQEGSVKFSRTSFLTKQVITSLDVSAETNGLRHVTMKGYSNDAAAAAEAIASGVASGVASALKKP